MLPQDQFEAVNQFEWIVPPVQVLDEFTVTTALPVISAAIAVHFESLNAVTVYVFVDVGVTLKV